MLDEGWDSSYLSEVSGATRIHAWFPAPVPQPAGLPAAGPVLATLTRETFASRRCSCRSGFPRRPPRPRRLRSSAQPR
eukprot:770124-Prymnesium_polylepis.1